MDHSSRTDTQLTAYRAPRPGATSSRVRQTLTSLERVSIDENSTGNDETVIETLWNANIVLSSCVVEIQRITRTTPYSKNSLGTNFATNTHKIKSIRAAKSNACTKSSSTQV